MSPLDLRHLDGRLDGAVAILTLRRPGRRNALTFDSYRELLAFFQALPSEDEIAAVVLTGADGDFCSGGDVIGIIGPLTGMAMPEILGFTRMTGDLVRAMRLCPQPIVAAVQGVAAGAGAILAMASDLRFGTIDCGISFLFTKAGLAGCDMGACTILPRIVGQGRATELLLTGRRLSGEEAERWGFLNRLCSNGAILEEAIEAARAFAAGPRFAQGLTKAMLYREWAMDLDTALEAEAQAQALCMTTADFRMAHAAFLAKRAPVFGGS